MLFLSRWLRHQDTGIVQDILSTFFTAALCLCIVARPRPRACTTSVSALTATAKHSWFHLQCLRTLKKATTLHLSKTSVTVFKVELRPCAVVWPPTWELHCFGLRCCSGRADFVSKTAASFRIFCPLFLHFHVHLLQKKLWHRCSLTT